MRVRDSLKREKHRRFVKEFPKDCSLSLAAKRAGFLHPGAGSNLVQRPEIRAAIAREIEARNARLEIQADDVLRALLRQAQRLEAMLGYSHRWLEIYDSTTGSLRPVNEWPEWAAHMVEGIESEDSYERSHDGVDAAKPEEGDKRGGWDRAGVVNKIKRAGTLAIEKELRECWKVIGTHVRVKAFPVPGEKLADAVGDLAMAIRWQDERETEVIDVTPKKLT